MGLKLQTKLLLGFLFVALIGSAIGFVGILTVQKLATADKYLYDNTAVALGVCVGMDSNFQNLRVVLLKILLASSPAELQGARADLGKFRSALAKDLKDYSGTFLDDTDKANFTAFQTALGKYQAFIDSTAVKAALPGKKAEAAEDTFSNAADGGHTISGEAQAALGTMVGYNVAVGARISGANTAQALSTTILLLVITLVGLAVSVFLAVWMGVFMVSRPLLRISETLSAGAGQIGSASGQLTAASQDIANGASEQASSVEETSSSMEELSSMVKQNVGNAKEASRLADQAAAASTAGFAQMEKMLEAMYDISRSSEKIKKVIKVIDDIAFKTNILALNAAVEAARAGEAGMGFAVVADEVKNLANQAAEAAKETEGMVEDSLKKTSGGQAMAAQLGSTFQEILTAAKKVSEMVREVETASVQQDTGIDQVNKAIVQFDEVVQTNASGAEETAGAAEELQSQVASLEEMVGQLTRLVTGRSHV